MSFNWKDVALTAATGGAWAGARAMGVNPWDDNSIDNGEAAPGVPDYSSTQNADGSLKTPYQMPTDNTGLDALKQRATQAGPSAWAQMMTDKANTEQATGMDQATARSASATAGAQGNLMMRGGMTGGARLQTQLQGQNNTLGAQQDVAKQGITNRQDIGIQDEQIKQGAVQQLAGYDHAADQYNAQAAGQNNQNQNTYNMSKYGQQLQAWGGNKMAYATEHSGKKS